MAYTHLTYEERYTLWTLKRAQMSIRQISRLMNRSPSTISRELRRNRGDYAYRARRAQAMADARHRRPIVWKFVDDLVVEVEGLLKQQWSPEQISGWLSLQGRAAVSHERIYQHVYTDAASGGDLWHNLRRIRRKRRRRGPGPGHHAKIRDQRLIDSRPEAVDSRSRIGDWEGDTMVGEGHKGYVVTLVERRSRLFLAGKCPTRKAQDVNRVVRGLLQDMPARIKHTLTLDNGSEFAKHKELEKATGLAIYFAHPYHAWERGANENANGLLRQFFPKKTNFRDVSAELLAQAVARLNGRPRKKLGYLSPVEYLQMNVDALAGENCPASLRFALGPLGRPFGDGLHSAMQEPSDGTSEASSPEIRRTGSQNKNTGVALVS
jgi:IS30 family transposase